MNINKNEKQMLCSEKGIALIMVLVLSAIGLGLMTALIYMVTTGVQVSGMQKHYKTALEAGMGGKDMVLQVLTMKDSDMTEIDPFFTALNDAGITAVHTTSDTCTDTTGVVPSGPGLGLLTKMRASYSSWSTGCTGTLPINPAVPTTYDMSFEVGTNPRYTVYAKIVDMVSGSPVGESTGLHGGGVTAGQDVIQVAGIPNLYTIEIQTQNSVNAQEKAKIQVLYQY